MTTALRLAQHVHDLAAQLARRPERVDQLEIVVGQQRREDFRMPVQEAGVGVADPER